MRTHLNHIDKVCERLHSDNLRLSAHKCEIATKTLRYLGFIISGDGILPDPDKVAPLRRITRLNSLKETKSFLGMVNYFANHVPSLYKIVHPLQKNLKKGATFEWGKAQEEALHYIIKTLTEEPVLLHYPDFNLSFALTCDASKHGLASFLSQTGTEGLKVIAYYSKSFNSAESRYSALDSEVAAVYYSVKHFEVYLRSSPGGFDLYTDHRSILYLNSIKNPSPRLFQIGRAHV